MFLQSFRSLSISAICMTGGLADRVIRPWCQNHPEASQRQQSQRGKCCKPNLLHVINRQPRFRHGQGERANARTGPSKVGRTDVVVSGLAICAGAVVAVGDRQPGDLLRCKVPGHPAQRTVALHLALSLQHGYEALAIQRPGHVSRHSHSVQVQQRRPVKRVQHPTRQRPAQRWCRHGSECRLIRQGFGGGNRRRHTAQGG